MQPQTPTSGRKTLAPAAQALPEVGLNENPPALAGDARAAADELLAALLNAENAYRRSRAYGRILEHVTDQRGVVAVWDGACHRVKTLPALYSDCLRKPERRPGHDTDTCRWATTDDQLYGRYPLIDTTWRTAS